MTIKEITESYDVSRTTLYHYRRAGTFPRPLPAQGVERVKVCFVASEVAAWFRSHPKRQGRRTDLSGDQS